MTNKAEAHIRKLQQAVARYADTQYPAMAGRKALRFIDDNFRAQSWEGMPWKRRKSGDNKRGLLVLRGFLRRSPRMQAMRAAVRIFTDVKYARVHNEGFHGAVTIRAHTRRTYGKFSVSSVATRRGRTVKASTGVAQVKTHTRNMHIPRRQFMPSPGRPSQKLTDEVKRQIRLDIYKILKHTK